MVYIVSIRVQNDMLYKYTLFRTILYVFEFLLLKRLPNNYSFCINLKVKGFDEKIKRNLAYILTHRIIFKKSDNG